MNLIISEEASQACIRELGTLGCLQFTDLNPELTPFQRRYVANIKRCDEMERKIRYVHGEVRRMGVAVQPAGSIEDFVENAHRGEHAGSSGSYMLESVESRLDNYEQQLTELIKYSNKLSAEYARKVEYHHLLVKARKFLGAVTEIENSEIEEAARHGMGFAGEIGVALSPLISGSLNSSSAEERGSQYHGSGDEMVFSNIAGVLPTADRVRFERMLFRSTRGNCYVRFSLLSEKAVDAFGERIPKVCFIVFYKSAAIESKIVRICEAFSAHRYDLSELNRPDRLEGLQRSNHMEMLDAKAVLDKNTETRLRLCVELAKYVEEWLWIVRREKSIYHTLNQFKTDVAGSNFLRGRAWILTDMFQPARAALHRAHVVLNLPQTALMEPISRPESWPTAPTFFRTNKYTYGFQEFVNTYGMPRYREANPALFTAASFPFLFGVMYGDMGHGSILTIAALFLVLTERRMESRGMDEMLRSIYQARYMLLGMGCCAVYAGLIYNDFFSLGLNLFGSKYTYSTQESGAKATMLGTYGSSETVYPFGVDPAWKISENELLFFNSMKMKMSVILGISQMTLGIMLRGMNAVFFNQWLDFLCEFLPMIIFDVAFFGYMVLLIFVKWSINWDDRMKLGSCNYDSEGVFGACSVTSGTGTCYTSMGTTCTADTNLVDLCPLDYGGTGDGCQPPNLISTLIDIVLKPGHVAEPMFAGQGTVQTVILLVAFVCVPWLLLGKPLYLNHEHKQKVAAGDLRPEPSSGAGSSAMATSSHQLLSSNSTDSDTPLTGGDGGGGHGHGHGHGHGGEFEFGEIMIHQAIETIEFVLGMVSNTASYLRLWALSLAHTELASVFWEKAMLSTIDTNNPVLVFMVSFHRTPFGLQLFFHLYLHPTPTPLHFTPPAANPTTTGIRRLRCRDYGCAAVHGRSRMLLARPPVALGRVSEQVLQGRRLQICTVLF